MALDQCRDFFKRNRRIQPNAFYDTAGSVKHVVEENLPDAAGIVVITYAVLSLIPLVWIFMTSFRTPNDAIAYPPKVVAEQSLIGYVNLFTTRSRQTPEFLASLPPPQTWYERLVRSRNMVIGGPSKVMPRFANSMIIAFGSTFLAVCFGTIAAYAFYLSRSARKVRARLDAASRK